MTSRGCLLDRLRQRRQQPIYYALGLVAIYAPGMTPVVFVIAGLIFAATAAT